MPLRWVGGPVRVRVPATSANLGPGFDALGLALGLYDEVTAHITGDGLVIDVAGEGSADVARTEAHLVVRCMHRTFDLLGERPTGLALTCRNRIPHSRGLGSSAAAIVAGVLLARALVVDGPAKLSDAEVLALAAAIEGHPDNVAPCLLGGLTVAWTSGVGGGSGPDDNAGSARAVRRDVDPTVRPVVFIPPHSASTEAARGLLPAMVPHADASFAAGRAALLITALTGSPEALFDATQDRLHQTYREPAMPDSLALVARLRAEGLSAVISGAGPTVLVLARGDVEAETARVRAPDGWTAVRLPVDTSGATVQSF